MVQLINWEQFTNIQKAQAGLTKLFLEASKSLSFFRVLKNDQPVGVLIPNNLWESLTEDIEALSSPKFRGRVAVARQNNKLFSANEVKKTLKV